MLTIGEVALRAGVRTSAIRYYEQIGLLPLAQRSSGRRQFPESTLLRLTVIRFARDNGFTLRQIHGLFAGKPYSSRLRQLASAKILELDGVVERAQVMQSLLKSALRCKCLTLEECGRRLGAPDGSSAPRASRR
jgi:MerR family redox-sensitive transcriptional activator SoxR